MGAPNCRRKAQNSVALIIASVDRVLRHHKPLSVTLAHVRFDSTSQPGCRSRSNHLKIQGVLAMQTERGPVGHTGPTGCFRVLRGGVAGAFIACCLLVLSSAVDKVGVGPGVGFLPSEALLMVC